MCLSVVAKIVQISPDSDTAIAELNGVKKRINIGFLKADINENDWVLIHTGFAIAKINKDKATEILSIYDSME